MPPARESSLLQRVGTLVPVPPEQTEAAARFARQVAERDDWDAAEVLAMLGVAS